MAKKTKFIFTEALAYELVRLPDYLKRSGFSYAMNYGLGRMEAADDELFDPLTREIDRANREKMVVSAEDVKEIVRYLNEVCGTAFRPSSERTRRLINTRYSEGYGIDDFRLMIDYMHDQWSGTCQAQYLRPETLFGPKFEGYLQAAKADSKRQKEKSSFDGKTWFDDLVKRTYGDLGGGEAE